MPNRILKESICYSNDIEKLNQDGEIFFYRLIVNCDDFGRCDARPQMLKAKLYPLREHMTSDDINRYLMMASDNGLIILYENNEVRYLQIIKWEKHQQVRAKRSKYPGINDEGSSLIIDDIKCNQLKSNDDSNIQTKTISNDIVCNQMQSNDTICHRNPILSESLSLSESKIILGGECRNGLITKECKIIYEHYNELGLIKHKAFTKAMENAIKSASKDNHYTLEDCLLLLTRHSQIVKATKGNDMPVERRSLDAFFGQKVYQAKHLICSEYEDGGAKWERYRNLVKTDLCEDKGKIDLNVIATSHVNVHTDVKGDEPR